MVTKDRANIPLFDLYGLEALAESTPYSVSYLLALKLQPHRITPRFRDVVSRILGRSEAELFDGVADAGAYENTPDSQAEQPEAPDA